MKALLTILLLSTCFFQACQTPKQPANSNLTEENLSAIDETNISYHFQIPAIYSYTNLALDSNIVNNQWITLNGNWEAKLYENSGGDIFVALNRQIQETACVRYEAVLLINNENVFEKFYPSIDIYSFYSFEDKKLQQFEGDEQTIFSGYRFDFQEDSLALQFMLCKENNLQTSIMLNKSDGKLKKVALMQVK